MATPMTPMKTMTMKSMKSMSPSPRATPPPCTPMKAKKRNFSVFAPDSPPSKKTMKCLPRSKVEKAKMDKGLLAKSQGSSSVKAMKSESWK